MIKILIVDDNIDKISQIIYEIKEILDHFEHDSVQDIQNAIKLLHTGKYDLAIIDILLPFRFGEEPLRNGGNILMKEIYRKSDSINLPNYFLGLTQYATEYLDFSRIWKVLQYDLSSSIWGADLRELLKHIEKTKRDVDTNKIVYYPTLFLEGETDKTYIERAIDIFHPDVKGLFTVKTQQNAGANWVANEIGAWGMKMTKDEFGNYVKAVSLLDADNAGNIAKREVLRILDTGNKQQTFKILQIEASLNKHLINFYKEKCKIEMEIESLFPIEIWQHADTQFWLENRNPVFVESPNDWDSFHMCAKDYLITKNIFEPELLYTKKVKLNCKDKFLKYAMAQKDINATFINFKPLIEKILLHLEIRKQILPSSP